LSIADYDADALKDIEAYNKIKDDIYNKDEKTSSVDSDNIDKMPMSEIEKSHESQLKHLSADNQATLNGALKELEEGNITRQEYLSLMQGLLAVDDNTAEDTSILKNIDTNLLKNEMINILKATGTSSFNHYVLKGGFQQLSKQTSRIADEAMNAYLKGVGAQYNPTSEKQFNVAKDMNKKSWLYRGVGKIAGPVAGFGYGMYDDLANNDKTVGEAVAHNAAAGSAGLATGLATVLVFGNPTGLATVAIAAGGAYLFDLAYRNDFRRIQSKLDAVGSKIDDVWEGTKDVASKAGEAISNTVSAMNPKNWAW